MIKTKKVGACLMIISLAIIALSLAPSITGNAINIAGEDFSNYFSIFGLILFFVSTLLMVERETLDVIVIPTGAGEFDPETKMYSQDKARAQKALERINRLDEDGYFVISGYKGENVRKGQPYSIYNFLREHGVKPSQIVIEGSSRNTLENVVNTLDKVKKIEEKRHGDSGKPIKIAFVSYGGHLRRFEDYEKQAIKNGIIDKRDFEFHRIRVKPLTREQKEKERDYESNLARRAKHKIKLLTMRKRKSG